MFKQTDLPLITCICVTAPGRLPYFKRSLRCFMDQIYPNKELLVLNEGPRSYQNDLYSVTSGLTNVHCVFLDGKYTLGALRNISIGLAMGDIICQWDDDDFNAPNRLSAQFKYLSANPKAKVAFLSDQLHFYFNRKELYWESWFRYGAVGQLKYNLIPGTLMARKQGFTARYPASGQHSDRGEDTVLANQFCENPEDVVLVHDIGYLQMYSFHGANTWEEGHHMQLSRNRSMPIDWLMTHRFQIEETLRYLDLEGPISVKGREGTAFEFLR